MLVRDVMKSPVLTVGPEATLEEAYKLLLERGIRHLPVVEEGRLVGIVTDRDIRLATSHLNPKGPCPGCTRVGEVMTREVVTAHPLDPVEEAARVMRERKIGCLPVLEDEAWWASSRGLTFWMPSSGSPGSRSPRAARGAPP